MIDLIFHCTNCGTRNEKKLLSLTDSARSLALSGQTLNRWRRLGYIRFHTVGRGFYFEQSFLDEALSLRGYDKADNTAYTEVIVR